jgi:phage shock protein A
MNLITRLSELLSENGAARFEHEMPEVVLAQVLRELTEIVDCARAHAASVFAVERRLERELERNRAEAQRWHVLAAYRPHLADRVLRYAGESDDRVRELEERYTTARLNSEHVRTGLRDLEARLARVRTEQELCGTAELTECDHFGALQRQFEDLEAEWLGLRHEIDYPSNAPIGLPRDSANGRPW